MDGLDWTAYRPGSPRPTPAPAPAPRARPPALLLPDFDAPPPSPPAPGATGPSSAEVEVMLEAVREAALAEGRAEGERAGHAAAAASRAALLDGALLAALSRLEQVAREAAAAAEANAQALATLLLRTMDAALPGAAARFAPDMLDRLVAQLGPLPEAPSGATMLVPPALLEEARTRLAGRGLPVEADPSLPAGDARIAWRGGGLALDLAGRRRAVRDVLLSLGLTREEREEEAPA